MGQKLCEYFVEAEKLGAANARMRLVMLTQIQSGKASELPDSPELIEKFETVIKRLREEYKTIEKK